jgi:hypothetical protein
MFCPPPKKRKRKRKILFTPTKGCPFENFVKVGNELVHLGSGFND